MKHNNKRLISPVFIAVCASLLLAACSKVEVPSVWDGAWQRTVLVPREVQGRCIEETLLIQGKQWNLNAVIHATFECKQPFLEVGFEGVIETVNIRRDTDDRDVRLHISGIHMVTMFDISKAGKVALSSSLVDELSDKYVPEQFRDYEQAIYLSADAATMSSGIYRPVQDLAIPQYPEGVTPADYRRLP